MLLIAASINIAVAHDGHAHANGVPQTTFHLKDGNHLHGWFVAMKNDLVYVRLPSGEVKSYGFDTLSTATQRWVTQRTDQINAVNHSSTVRLIAQPPQSARSATPAPKIAAAFKPFASSLQLTWDQNHLYVGSNGIPDHPMMIGIRSWQQQVPIPQAYFGTNAWRIPLHPVPAKTPATTKNRFLRGAIALAVNGIPIFNPLNNRGDDAYLFGELDEYGGHCGRADDYHYHLAPVHLEKITGKGEPIAFALDGYPIYGYQDPQAPDFAPLDTLNGHRDASGNYHYHATPKYPYLNGGFFGEVVERDGQVDPQPRAEPLRPALSPLQGATITDFRETQPGSYRLTYQQQGRPGYVQYTVQENGNATFQFIDTAGKRTSATYTKRGGPPPRRGNNNVPQPPPGPAESNRRTDTTASSTSGLPKLSVTSRSVDAQGRLSIDCTCDGKSQSPAVAWSGAPPATQAYAISLWHTAPDQEKSYWLVYNIPATTTDIAQNTRPPGVVGMNDRRQHAYDPMCSKGPGAKTYHLTVYALSQPLDLHPTQASRTNLLQAIRAVTLAEGTLDFSYERTGR